MTKCVPAEPVCSRSGTTRIATTPGAKTTNVAVDPVCRRVSGSQVTVPPPAN